MQAYAEPDGAALLGGAFADVFDLLFDGGGWFAPGEVGVHVGGEVVGSRGGAAEIQRG
jgi:hypothetical protein